MSLINDALKRAGTTRAIPAREQGGIPMQPVQDEPSTHSNPKVYGALGVVTLLVITIGGWMLKSKTSGLAESEPSMAPISATVVAAAPAVASTPAALPVAPPAQQATALPQVKVAMEATTFTAPPKDTAEPLPSAAPIAEAAPAANTVTGAASQPEPIHVAAALAPGKAPALPNNTITSEHAQPEVAAASPASAKVAPVEKLATLPKADPDAPAASATALAQKLAIQKTANPAVKAAVQPVSQAATQPAAPAVKPAPAAPITTAPQNFPEIKLQAIYYRVKNPSVMVNGKTRRIGENIDGAKLTAIHRYGIELNFRGTNKFLALD